MERPLCVAVIGGGITGMVAARELLRAGHSVTLVEKGSALGGLARSFPIAGTNLERAYHHCFRTDEALLALIRELGLEGDLVWRKSSVGLATGGRVFPLSGALDLLRLTPLSFFDRVRAGVALFILQQTSRWERFEGVTAMQWMKHCSGARVYALLWEPLLRGKFHRFAEEVSMAWLWARIHARANSRSRGGEKLGTMRGGFQRLVTALEEDLIRRGAEVRVSCVVGSIRRTETSEGYRAVMDGEERAFDRVILTVPSCVAADLLVEAPMPYRESLRSIRYLSAVTLVFGSPQSLVPYYWTNVVDPSSPFLALIQHTQLADPAWYGGQHLYYLGAYLPDDHPLLAASDDGVRESFFPALKRMVPAFEERQVTEVQVFRFPFAQHVPDCGYRKRIPDHRTPMQGVYLSNFSQIFPTDRGVNEAVREGREIATMVLEK